MRSELAESQFKPEPRDFDVEKREQEMNDIIPILSHGLVRRLENRGLSGKVRIRALAGDDWGIGKSSENPTNDIPNIISYPREYLREDQDKKLINARLRHEIGNLNYPIEGDLNSLRQWCEKNKIAPELLTSLVGVVHESSVNYLEMRNSYGKHPEENFRALYDKEVNTENIASDIGDQAPYKQAIDLSLLYTLSQIGLCSKDNFDEAFQNSHPAVKEVFDAQSRTLLDQAVKMAVPKKQIQLLRDYVWPKFSRLVAIQPPTQEGSFKEDSKEIEQNTKENKQSQKQSSEQSRSIDERNTQEQSGEQSDRQSQKQGEGAESEPEETERELQESEDGKPGAEEGQEYSEKLQKELQDLQEMLNQTQGNGESDQPSSQKLNKQAKAVQKKIEEMINEAQKNNFKAAEALQNLQEQFQQAAGQGGERGQDTNNIQEKMRLVIDQIDQIRKDLQEQINNQQSKPSNDESELGKQSVQTQSESSDSDKSEGKNEKNDSAYDEFQRGGAARKQGLEHLFSNPNEELLKQLQQSEEMVGSKFSGKDEQGNIKTKNINEQTFQQTELKTQIIAESQKHQIGTLETLKRQQQKRLEAIYKEMSGLEGQTLKIYIENMESMKDFIQDLTEFFVEKFKLDQEYSRIKNQYSGARLQRNYQKHIIGVKEGKVVIHPQSFERKLLPEKPQFAWTLIIDNSSSCAGEIIKQEKRLAVALIEVAKKLDIPFEIVTFGGEKDGYVFLKTFEQDVVGEDLQKIVLLNADQGTPDVATLDAAGKSMQRFTDQFKNSYNFIYFMTDGESGEGSIQDIIERYKRSMVMTGIGLDSAARKIKKTWGKNALEVPDIKKLSDLFIRKIEDQIDETFD